MLFGRFRRRSKVGSCPTTHAGPKKVTSFDRFRTHSTFSRFWNSSSFINKNSKMSAWRQVGLNYINYSNIAAKVLRHSLKAEFRADALKRDSSHVRITPWVNGKPAPAQAAAK